MNEVICRISAKPIKKSIIEAEILPPSASVIICNLEKKRSSEFYKLYFSNSEASGVSKFNDIEMLDDGQVIVHLLDQASELIMVFM